MRSTRSVDHFRLRRLAFASKRRGDVRQAFITLADLLRCLLIGPQRRAQSIRFVDRKHQRTLTRRT